MYQLVGSANRFCDGRSRRSFLQIGGLALGGLTLPDLLRAESAASKTKSHKAIILVYLSGGLAHQDSFDLKPDSPAEVRGEFKPIDTNLPGLKICGAVCHDILDFCARVLATLAHARPSLGDQSRGFSARPAF